MKKNNPLKKRRNFGLNFHPAKLEVVLYDGVRGGRARYEWNTVYATHPLWIILKETLIHDHYNKPTKH